MSLENLSRVVDHERAERRRAAMTMAVIATVFAITLIAVIAVLAWM